MYKIVPTSCFYTNQIHEIEKECFTAPWSLSALNAEVERPTSIGLMALDASGTIVAGHISMRHVINEGHISNIAAAKAHRRKGIASLLLQNLINEAAKREMIGLTLEVRVSNHAAISLYKKFGFETEGQRKNYYANPTEDAFIMWKKF